MTVTLVVIGGGPRVSRPGPDVGVRATATLWSVVPSLGRPEGGARSLALAHPAAAAWPGDEGERKLTVDEP